VPVSGDATLSPCFIPARLYLTDAVHDVNLTRIGTDRALISSSAPVDAGAEAELELNRPTDGQRVRILVRVTSVRREGNLRGWTPSLLVMFDQPLDQGDEVAYEETQELSYSMDDESSAFEHYTMEELMPPEPTSLHDDIEERIADLPTVLDQPSEEVVPELETGAWEDISSDGAPGWGGVGAESLPPGALDLLDDDALDDRVTAESDPSDASMSIDATLPPDDGQLPPGASLSSDGELPDPDSLTSSEFKVDWRPEHGTPRRESAHIPYLDDPGAIEPLTSEREARVLSEVAVGYMLAGQRQAATVQDFGKDGLYLAVEQGSRVPTEGDVLRIDFPVVTPSEVLMVRMFVQVRWSYGAQEPGTSGRGVGVRIVDFENPAERQVYEDYVMYLLADSTT
jgi:hypothetical protein